MYQEIIREECANLELTEAPDPRHVEAWMRLEYGTLDARSRFDFQSFIIETIAIERVSPGSSEALAQSYNL